MYSTPVRRPLAASLPAGRNLRDAARSSDDIPNLNNNDDPFGFTRTLLRSGMKSADYLPLLDSLSTEDIGASDTSTIPCPPLTSPTKLTNTVDIKNSRVYFAHDPELDSTPFVYLPSMNSNRPIFISTAYQTPCHSRIVSNQAVDRPVSVKSKDEEDLFGLGAFSDVFISDQDLEHAAEKLQSEQSKTKKEIIEDCLDELKRFAVAIDRPAKASDEIASVRLCFNFMILGAGGIGVSATNLLWIGNLMGDDEPIALCWPIGRLSDVRVKCLSDEPPMLLLTVDGQMFIQMQSSTEVAADRLSAICEQVKTLMKPPPRRDFVNSAAMDLIEKRKSDRLTKLQQAFDRKIHQLNQELANRKTLIIEQAARELQQLQQSSNQQPAANFLPQSSTQGDSAEASSSECKLCYANDIQVEFQPCRHQLCSECCLRLQQNSSDKFSCPWDRSLVESVKHLQSILQ